jgi:hypothetical protein
MVSAPLKKKNSASYFSIVNQRLKTSELRHNNNEVPCLILILTNRNSVRNTTNVTNMLRPCSHLAYNYSSERGNDYRWRACIFQKHDGTWKKHHPDIAWVWRWRPPQIFACLRSTEASVAETPMRLLQIARETYYKQIVQLRCGGHLVKNILSPKSIMEDHCP